MSAINTTFLGYGDKVAAASVTGSGSWELPVTNIQDRRLKKIARNTGAVAVIEIVFAADVQISMLALLNTNASGTTSTWALFSDTGLSVPVDNGLFVDYGITSDASNLYAIVEPDRNITVRSLRYSLATTGAKCYLGRAWASPIFVSAQGGQFGSFGREWVDPSVVVTAYDGTRYIDERAMYRRTRCTFHAMTEDEAETRAAADGAPYLESLYRVEKAVGKHSEIILLPNFNPTGASTQDARRFDAQATYGLAEWGETEHYERTGGGLLYRKQVVVGESV